MIYAAIDPGISGGIAFIKEGEACVFSVPFKVISKYGKSRKDFDIHAMVEIFKPYVEKDILVLQEATHAMPNNGSVSMYFFGRGAGIWEGILNALDIKYVQISPQIWKKYYPELLAEKIKTPKNATKQEKKDINNKKRLAKSLVKEKARNTASLLFPKISNEFTKVKDDGKAESLLMAYYLSKNTDNITK